MDTSARLASPVDDQDYSRGPENALVTVVEYADFACPYSGQLYQVLKQLGDDIGEKFRLVYRNFPLTQTRPNALPAALAAEAAGLQTRFWEMHDMLFERQDELDPEYLLIYAQVLGLDLEHFIFDMTSDRLAAAVREDFVTGLKSGVNGAPTLYINGLRHDGTHDYEALKTAIEQTAVRRAQTIHSES